MTGFLMDEEIISTFGRGEWVDQTTLNPLGLILMLVCGLAMLTVHRRYVIWPIVIIACFVASAQRIVVLSLDFNMLRIMVLFGLARIFFKHEYRGFEKQPLDKIIILYVIARLIIHFIREPSAGTLIFELGNGFDAIGMYFLFRMLIRSWEDVEQIIKAFLVTAIPVAAFFVIEYHTAHNVFSVFGGVPEITFIREGRLRCQGAFDHPILAGAFWATLLPLIAARWWDKSKNQTITVIGLLSAGWIVIASSSSTPIFGAIMAILGGFLFTQRYKMKSIRWGLLATIISLHLIMKAPVWHLISRVSAVGGSTSYHRYLLIDAAIRNINEWWLLGIQSTAHWFHNAVDLTNQYVAEGVRGGMLSLMIFLIGIAIAFRSVGRIWRRVENNKAQLAMSWALGVCLFVHCVNFIGVSYFGQIIILWYMVLAIITSIDLATEKAYLVEHTESKNNEKMEKSIDGALPKSWNI